MQVDSTVVADSIESVSSKALSKIGKNMKKRKRGSNFAAAKAVPLPSASDDSLSQSQSQFADGGNESEAGVIVTRRSMKGKDSKRVKGKQGSPFQHISLSDPHVPLPILMEPSTVVEAAPVAPPTKRKRIRSAKAKESSSESPQASRSSSPHLKKGAMQQNYKMDGHPAARKSFCTLTLNIALTRIIANPVRPLPPLISFQPVSSLSPLPHEESPLRDTLDQRQDDIEAAIEMIFRLSNEEVIAGMNRVTGVLGLKKLVDLGEMAKRKMREPSNSRR
jgi:hypothetical protein